MEFLMHGKVKPIIRTRARVGNRRINGARLGVNAKCFITSKRHAACLVAASSSFIPGSRTNGEEQETGRPSAESLRENSGFVTPLKWLGFVLVVNERATGNLSLIIASRVSTLFYRRVDVNQFYRPR